jgi:diguanylate cyclase (GGDEF)-like protein/PAS domain S-box-containing protein
LIISTTVYIVWTKIKIIYWNSGAERSTGYTESEVIGKHCFDDIIMDLDESGVKLCDGLCPISEAINDGRRREINVYFQHKEGFRVPAAMRVVPLKDEEHHTIVAVEILGENSPKFSLHEKIEELQSLALLDPLVEIGNRRYLEIRLNTRLEEMKRYGWPLGVLYIDIDNFKDINDKFGNVSGDKVLKVVGKTLMNSIRPFDVLGRWGGEEFIAILANVKREQLHPIANRLRLLVEQSNIPVGKESVQRTISIGATVGYHNDTVDTLIKRAEQLIYQSKASGKNSITCDGEG